MEADLERRTVRDFGEQWLAYRANPGYYGSTELLSDIFGPLISLNAVQSMQVADIGSGTGRIINMLLDAGAAHVIAVEPSAAMSVLKQNTAARRERITYVHATGASLTAGLGLDLVVSIGVLHHIPDPAPVVRAAFDALRPGGEFFAWLYGREGNEAYLRFAEPLRRITTRLPHFVLASLSFLLALGLDAYIVACQAVPLPMHQYMRSVLAKVPRRVRRWTIYDQLNPAYTKYYSRSDAEQLLSMAGFAEIRTYHRHGYSWSVSARKPPEITRG